jgi:hypothetical protein
VAVAQEPFANVRADEARAAGDEKIHGRKLNSGGQSVESAGNFGRALNWNFIGKFHVHQCPQ